MLDSRAFDSVSSLLPPGQVERVRDLCRELSGAPPLQRVLALVLVMADQPAEVVDKLGGLLSAVFLAQQLGADMGEAVGAWLVANGGTPPASA